jgi:curved DNA-binding protein CbpA
VGPGASDDQVQAAYRRLVQIHHPDHNDGSVESTRRFEEIQDAYARVRRLRAGARSGGRAAEYASASPDLDARLEELEREVRKAHAARERARRAAAQAAAASTRRPSDEELGYVATDDSLAKILADARSELSDRLSEVREHPAGRRVTDLIDELAAKLRGEGPPRSRR